MRMVKLKYPQTVNGQWRNDNDGPVLVDDAEWTRLVKTEKSANCITGQYHPDRLKVMAGEQPNNLDSMKDLSS